VAKDAPKAGASLATAPKAAAPEVKAPVAKKPEVIAQKSAVANLSAIEKMQREAMENYEKKKQAERAAKEK